MPKSTTTLPTTRPTAGIGVVQKAKTYNPTYGGHPIGVVQKAKDQHMIRTGCEFRGKGKKRGTDST